MADENPGKPQGIGARVQRKEDARLMRGRGQYVSDMLLPGQQEVAFLRSPIAHGRIVAAVKPATGGERVFLRDDLVGVLPIIATSTLPGYQVSEHHPLARDKVRFVGEPVAMCVAPSRALAEDLAEQIELRIDALPALVDAHQALADASVRVHEHWRDNLFLALSYDKDFDEHASRAVRVVRREVSLARQAMMPMEGKAVLAYWDERADQLIVYSSTQVPHMIRVGLAQCLGIDEGKLRVIAPDVGGAFGYKCVLQPEEVCVAWLALRYRTPFRYVEDRREHLVAGANTRQHHYRLAGHIDEKGRLLALEAEITIDGGAYSNWPFTVGLEPGQATGNLPGPYAIQGYRARTRCVATNKPGFLPYRGVARTGVCFAIELLMDAIAREVGREPWEVRTENLVRPEQMPFDNVARKHYDSGDYPRSLRWVREAIRFDAVREQQRRGEPDGRLIGVGFATYCEQSAHGTSVFASWGLSLVPGYDQASVRVTPDGGLEVCVGVHSHGQGMETTLAQIAHEVLGIDVARVRVVHGDTGATPFSTGTYASRGIVMAGGAVGNACEALVPRLLRIGATLLGCDKEQARFEDGRVIGPGGSVSMRDVAQAWYVRPERLPKDVDLGGLEASVSYRPKVDTGVFSYASHAVVVAVDPLTGSVQLLDYVISEDCGTMVNPMIVEGQTIGGVMQGIGTALYEESPYDSNGQPLASTMMDYVMPGATESPPIRIHHSQTASPYTKFGIKGMGEGGAIAPPAAIFNAVNDALRGRAADLAQTPLTPAKVLAALAAGPKAREHPGSRP
jgi:carbon-monoxide dehydrogenase large subunit